MWERSSLESADCASSRCNNESAGLVVNFHQPVERLTAVFFSDFNKTIGFGYTENQVTLLIEKARLSKKFQHRIQLYPFV